MSLTSSNWFVEDRSKSITKSLDLAEVSRSYNDVWAVSSTSRSVSATLRSYRLLHLVKTMLTVVYSVKHFTNWILIVHVYMHLTCWAIIRYSLYRVVFNDAPIEVLNNLLFEQTVFKVKELEQFSCWSFHWQKYNIIIIERITSPDKNTQRISGSHRKRPRTKWNARNTPNKTLYLQAPPLIGLPVSIVKHC